MANNFSNPKLMAKVTKVNCKKCQYEGNIQDFSQASKYALTCPRCQEKDQLLFTFDNGKQFDLGNDNASRLTPRTVLAAIVAGIIFFCRQ